MSASATGQLVGQGSNSAVVRQFNERVVLAALRRLGEASKAELARQVNLTQNAAGQIVRELEQQRLVCAMGKRTGLRGQPATLLRLDPEGAYAIGIKLGRRSIDSLLVDFSGRVLRSRRHAGSFPSPEAALRRVRDDVAALRRAVPSAGAGRLAGVGIALPFNLGSWRRELDLSAEAAAAWTGFDIGAQLRETLDLPVVVENDGNAVAVAELFGGAGRELDDFAVVFIGTAVGGGLVLGGQFRRGSTGNAGDFGVMPVPASGLASAPVPAGGTDVLLNRASVNALSRHLRFSGATIAGDADLALALEAHPAAVDEWLVDCARALVLPLLSLSALLDLQAVVIDGRLPRPLLGLLIERLRVELVASAPEGARVPGLRAGTIGPDAAALGAAILPLHLNYGPDQDLLFG